MKLLTLFMAAAIGGISVSSPVKERVIIKHSDGKCEVDTASKSGDISIPFNESPAEDTWRLVHDGKRVLALFQSTGFTWTTNNLFCGSEKECSDVIDQLKLIPLPVVTNELDSIEVP